MSDQATRPGSQQAPTDGRDPNVRIPGRVKENAKRAEDLLKATQEPPVSEGNQPHLNISDAPAPAPVEQNASPPAATHAAPPANDAAPTANDFNAMKGRFERANRDAQRLSEEVTQLRNVIAQMNVAPAPAPAPQQQTPAELQAQSFLTPQEIADYGPEFLDVVGKKAREIAGSEIAQLRQQVENLSKGLQTTSQVTLQQARDNMLTALDEKVPDWRQLNTDPNFLQWLRLPDPFSGAIRQELLTQAYEQNNTPRVQAFFQGFLSEEAAVAPANNAPPVQPGAAPAKVSLETFAAPGRAKSAAASAPAEKPIITRAQVTAFYADVAAGKYRGREAEKNANEAAIFSATNEGRLR